MRISDWSSDVCSSDLQRVPERPNRSFAAAWKFPGPAVRAPTLSIRDGQYRCVPDERQSWCNRPGRPEHPGNAESLRYRTGRNRSEEHTSELQSLMRISYAVFCLKKKNNKV